MLLVTLISIIFAVLCFLTLLVSWRYTTHISQWWLSAIVLSVLCAAELFFIWHYAYNKGLEYHKNHTLINTKSTLNQQLNNFNKAFTAIPTGILIEHARFSRSDNEVYPGLLINGYIWQRYTIGQHDNINRGVILPDAAGQLNLKELYRKREGNQEIIGWSFAAHMFQLFKLTDFPFDHRHIKLQLQHVDFEKNVILSPDLESYKSLSPESLPGISNPILHWQTQESFFTYKLRDFKTNFGVKSFISNEFPQLYFYAIVQRMITDSALMYILLLIAAAIILFITLLAFLKDKALSGLLGFSTLGTLSVCSSLLFVLITSHIDMRRAIDIDGTAYLEYIYFIIYCAILIVGINSIIFAIYQNAKVVQREDSLIIKIGYWPVLLFSIVLVSFITLVY